MPATMSRGPVIVATPRAAASARWCASRVAPRPGCRRRRSSTSTPVGGRADDDQRDVPAGELRGERVVAVEADEDDAVDVAGRQVADGPALVDLVVGHQQDELQVARGERRADAAEQPREERVAEQPAGGLGDDDRDRLAAAGDEAPRRAVRDVAESIDGLLDRAPDVGADLGRAVDHARDGRAGHARDPATSSRVATVRRSRGLGWVIVDQLVRSSCESALTFRVAPYHPLSRERSTSSLRMPCTTHACGSCVRPPTRARRPCARLRPWPSRRSTGDAAAAGARPLRGRHRHRGPLPAADRVEDVLRLLDGLRRRRPEQPRLPGLPRPARARCRSSTAGPSSTSWRPASRSRRRPRTRRAGTARTTSTRTCPRATRSASTTCRWPRPAG